MRKTAWAYSLFLYCTALAAAETLNVYTVNYPLQYFAERIGAAHVEVSFPAPPDVDPAFWMPAAETIVQYQQADLILLNGADYARWISKASLPRLKLINTSKDFQERYLTVANATTHSHGLEGEHSHAGTFFTTWLDFSQAAQQARVIADAFARKSPVHKASFEENFAGLEKDLLSLDQQIQSMLQAKSQQPLLASHPVYEYFARRYGLDIESVLWEPDEVPNEEQWALLGRILSSYPDTTMIWEGPPLQASIERLRSLGVESIVFDPCANSCNGEDFLSVMQKNVETLKKTFR